MMLTISNVWKAFDSVPVLRGIDMQVNRHEVVALIGASGSGKSTLLRCINALETVDAGKIELDGELDITAFRVDVDQVRRRVGIVFQSYNLFPHMTVLRNICLAPRHVLKRDSAEAEEGARTLLARFGLSDKADEYPDRLSGGQAQRVAIVRALAMEPELMLFDEITSALDPMLVGEVLDAVRELKAGGLTIMMATHEMGFAKEVADQVYFLQNGTICEFGPPEQIFQAPQQPLTREFLGRILGSE
jgi:polar amino acid transport system ATP-binding protein